jgi:hypothetical protein
MSTTEIVLLIVVAGLVTLILANIAFQLAAERRNPPVGAFIECGGMRLHYIERGNAAAPCVVLFHGNGTMIQDLILSGLVERLAKSYRVVCFDSVRVPFLDRRPQPHLDEAQDVSIYHARGY